MEIHPSSFHVTSAPYHTKVSPSNLPSGHTSPANSVLSPDNNGQPPPYNVMQQHCDNSGIQIKVEEHVHNSFDNPVDAGGNSLDRGVGDENPMCMVGSPQGVASPSSQNHQALQDVHLSQAELEGYPPNNMAGGMQYNSEHSGAYLQQSDSVDMSLVHQQHQQQQHELYLQAISKLETDPSSPHGQVAMAHVSAQQAALYGHPSQQLYNGHHYLHPDARGTFRNYGGYSPSAAELLGSQRAIAFLAGPRERIHVMGNPIEFCPRCQQEGFGAVPWRPHRHIGELKIRYICERHFEDLDSNHHFDIPLCPLCGQVLYLYEFNGMLGVSSARRLHKYVLKCGSRHVLPLIDLFCQTKRGNGRCFSNFKLQWSYGTMVKRCEAQKNRDHDLWWVRYKNEWKQRRTIIRYKKDFLRHLSDVQRALLLGLGVEGEPSPDPKIALGPMYDALIASAGGSPAGPKIKKRRRERASMVSRVSSSISSPDEYDYSAEMSGGPTPAKRQQREIDSVISQALYSQHGQTMGVANSPSSLHHMLGMTDVNHRHSHLDSLGQPVVSPASFTGDSVGDVSLAGSHLQQDFFDESGIRDKAVPNADLNVAVANSYQGMMDERWNSPQAEDATATAARMMMDVMLAQRPGGGDAKCGMNQHHSVMNTTIIEQ